jgi:hypothetical protein
MVRAQMLSELEEVIAYKQLEDQPERQKTIKKTWVKRFVCVSVLVPSTQSSPGFKDVSLM